MPSSCVMTNTTDLLKIRMFRRKKVKINLQGSSVDMKLDTRCWLEMMTASLRLMGWRGCTEALRNNKVLFAWIHYGGLVVDIGMECWGDNR